MGGDGGVIPKNRRYLRGAGASDKTGNDGSGKGHDRADSAVVREEQARAMRICAMSGRPLPSPSTKSGSTSSDSVVVCPYGRLYLKEVVVEALLEQKQTKVKDPRIEHIRGLKDLHPVRFHFGQSFSTKDSSGNDVDVFPSCPVRGTELNGLVPAVVLVPGSPEVPNVLSARAVHELGQEAINEEYGPVKRSIKLLPLGEDLEKIKMEHEAVKLAAETNKNNKTNGKSKKRKKLTERGKDEDATTISKKKMITQEAVLEKPVITQSKVLNSIFTQPTKLSDNEKADNLFARGS